MAKGFQKGHKGYSPWLGKKLPNEMKAKISKAHQGKKLSENHKQKLKENHTHSWLGKKHSLESRKIMSDKRKGANSYNWQGGITPINKAIRASLEFKLWREAVFERDEYTCVWCGLKSGGGKAVILHPDHIKPFAYYPELRFAIDNGRTLCIDCHKTTDTYGGKAVKYKR